MSILDCCIFHVDSPSLAAFDSGDARKCENAVDEDTLVRPVG